MSYHRYYLRVAPRAVYSRLRWISTPSWADSSDTGRDLDANGAYSGDLVFTNGEDHGNNTQQPLVGNLSATNLRLFNPDTYYPVFSEGNHSHYEEEWSYFAEKGRLAAAEGRDSDNDGGELLAGGFKVHLKSLELYMSGFGIIGDLREVLQMEQGLVEVEKSLTELGLTVDLPEVAVKDENNYGSVSDSSSVSKWLSSAYFLDVREDDFKAFRSVKKMSLYFTSPVAEEEEKSDFNGGWDGNHQSSSSVHQQHHPRVAFNRSQPLPARLFAPMAATLEELQLTLTNGNGLGQVDFEDCTALKELLIHHANCVPKALPRGQLRSLSANVDAWNMRSCYETLPDDYFSFAGGQGGGTLEEIHLGPSLRPQSELEKLYSLAGQMDSHKTRLFYGPPSPTSGWNAFNRFVPWRFQLPSFRRLKEIHLSWFVFDIKTFHGMIQKREQEREKAKGANESICASFSSHDGNPANDVVAVSLFLQLISCVITANTTSSVPLLGPEGSAKDHKKDTAKTFKGTRFQGCVFACAADDATCRDSEEGVAVENDDGHSLSLWIVDFLSSFRNQYVISWEGLRKGIRRAHSSLSPSLSSPGYDLVPLDVKRPLEAINLGYAVAISLRDVQAGDTEFLKVNNHQCNGDGCEERSNNTNRFTNLQWIVLSGSNTEDFSGLFQCDSKQCCDAQKEKADTMTFPSLNMVGIVEQPHLQSLTKYHLCSAPYLTQLNLDILPGLTHIGPSLLDYVRCNRSHLLGEKPNNASQSIMPSPLNILTITGAPNLTMPPVDLLAGCQAEEVWIQDTGIMSFPPEVWGRSDDDANPGVTALITKTVRLNGNQLQTLEERDLSGLVQTLLPPQVRLFSSAKGVVDRSQLVQDMELIEGYLRSAKEIDLSRNNVRGKVVLELGEEMMLFNDLNPNLQLRLLFNISRNNISQLHVTAPLYANNTKPLPSPEEQSESVHVPFLFESLDISHNVITDLMTDYPTPGYFPPGVCVESLFLDHNRLSSLPASLFLHQHISTPVNTSDICMRYLHALDVSHNLLEFLPTGLIHNASQFKYLLAHHNLITAHVQNQHIQEVTEMVQDPKRTGFLSGGSCATATWDSALMISQGCIVDLSYNRLGILQTASDEMMNKQKDRKDADTSLFLNQWMKDSHISYLNLEFNNITRFPENIDVFNWSTEQSFQSGHYGHRPEYHAYPQIRKINLRMNAIRRVVESPCNSWNIRNYYQAQNQSTPISQMAFLSLDLSYNRISMLLPQAYDCTVQVMQSSDRDSVSVDDETGKEANAFGLMLTLNHNWGLRSLPTTPLCARQSLSPSTTSYSSSGVYPGRQCPQSSLYLLDVSNTHIKSLPVHFGEHHRYLKVLGMGTSSVSYASPSTTMPSSVSGSAQNRSTAFTPIGSYADGFVLPFCCAISEITTTNLYYRGVKHLPLIDQIDNYNSLVRQQKNIMTVTCDDSHDNAQDGSADSNCGDFNARGVRKESQRVQVTSPSNFYFAGSISSGHDRYPTEWLFPIERISVMFQSQLTPFVNAARCGYSTAKSSASTGAVETVSLWEFFQYVNPDFYNLTSAANNGEVRGGATQKISTMKYCDRCENLNCGYGAPGQLHNSHCQSIDEDDSLNNQHLNRQRKHSIGLTCSCKSRAPDGYVYGEIHQKGQYDSAAMREGNEYDVLARLGPYPYYYGDGFVCEFQSFATDSTIKDDVGLQQESKEVISSGKDLVLFEQCPPEMSFRFFRYSWTPYQPSPKQTPAAHLSVQAASFIVGDYGDSPIPGIIQEAQGRCICPEKYHLSQNVHMNGLCWPDGMQEPSRIRLMPGNRFSSINGDDQQFIPVQSLSDSSSYWWLILTLGLIGGYIAYGVFLVEGLIWAGYCAGGGGEDRGFDAGIEVADSLNHVHNDADIEVADSSNYVHNDADYGDKNKFCGDTQFKCSDMLDEAPRSGQEEEERIGMWWRKRWRQGPLQLPATKSNVIPFWGNNDASPSQLQLIHGYGSEDMPFSLPSSTSSSLGHSFKDRRHTDITTDSGDGVVQCFENEHGCLMLPRGYSHSVIQAGYNAFDPKPRKQQEGEVVENIEEESNHLIVLTSSVWQSAIPPGEIKRNLALYRETVVDEDEDEERETQGQRLGTSRGTVIICGQLSATHLIMVPSSPSEQCSYYHREILPHARQQGRQEGREGGAGRTHRGAICRQIVDGTSSLVAMAPYPLQDHCLDWDYFKETDSSWKKKKKRGEEEGEENDKYVEVLPGHRKSSASPSVTIEIIHRRLDNDNTNSTGENCSIRSKTSSSSGIYLDPPSYRKEGARKEEEEEEEEEEQEAEYRGEESYYSEEDDTEEDGRVSCSGLEGEGTVGEYYYDYEEWYEYRRESLE
eukprot:Nk52_evm5s2402 gene=Nk52_evmTU5s2402